MAYDAKLAERVRGWALRHPELEEKSMFGGLCYLVGGNMLGGVKETDLIVRLGPAGEVHRGKPNVKSFPTETKSMPGFFRVETPGTATDKALAKWLDDSYAFAAALPAKAAKKKPAGAAAKKMPAAAAKTAPARPAKKTPAGVAKAPARKR